MELISGNTYWPNTLEQALDFPPLAEDLNCDVLIIGGGMGGPSAPGYWENDR